MGINSNDPILVHANRENKMWQLENSAGKLSAFQCLVAAFADWMTETDRRITVAASFVS